MPKTTETTEVPEIVESADTPNTTKLAKLKTIATNPKVLVTAATVTLAGAVLIVRSRNSQESESEDI